MKITDYSVKKINKTIKQLCSYADTESKNVVLKRFQMFYNSLKHEKWQGRDKMVIKKYLSENLIYKDIFLFISVCPYKIREHSDTFLIPSVKDFGTYKHKNCIFLFIISL